MINIFFWQNGKLRSLSAISIALQLNELGNTDEWWFSSGMKAKEVIARWSTACIIFDSTELNIVLFKEIIKLFLVVWGSIKWNRIFLQQLVLSFYDKICQNKTNVELIKQKAEDTDQLAGSRLSPTTVPRFWGSSPDTRRHRYTVWIDLETILKWVVTVGPGTRATKFEKRLETN